MAEGDCKCEECEEGAPLWMVTYSDMVTLLLCFFVMELSMANFLDPGKVERWACPDREPSGQNRYAEGCLKASPQRCPNQ